MDDNTLDFLKSVLNYFKKSTQTWGFIIILGSFPLFYASQPGMWEHLYSFFVNSNNTETTVHPETNIGIFSVGCLVLLFGIYTAIEGTKEKSERFILEYHDKLKNELDKPEEERSNSLVQHFFFKLFKYDASVSIIKTLYNSKDVSAATFYFKSGRKYIENQNRDISIDDYGLRRKKKILNLVYLIIIIVFIILLTSGWWMQFFFEKEKVVELMSYVIVIYILLMIPVATLINDLKKISSALHLQDILNSKK